MVSGLKLPGRFDNALNPYAIKFCFLFAYFFLFFILFFFLAALKSFSNPEFVSPTANLAADASRSRVAPPDTTGLNGVTTGEFGVVKSTLKTRGSAGPETKTILLFRNAIEAIAPNVSVGEVLTLTSGVCAAVPLITGAFGLDISISITRALKLFTFSPTATSEPRTAIAPIPPSWVLILPCITGAAGFVISYS